MIVGIYCYGSYVVYSYSASKFREILLCIYSRHKVASWGFTKMSKPSTSNLGVRTPQKRHRKQLSSRDTVSTGTNVSKEFVVAAKEMEKEVKHKKKHETLIKTDEEKNMARE